MARTAAAVRPVILSDTGLSGGSGRQAASACPEMHHMQILGPKIQKSIQEYVVLMMTD